MLHCYGIKPSLLVALEGILSSSPSFSDTRGVYRVLSLPRWFLMHILSEKLPCALLSSLHSDLVFFFWGQLMPFGRWKVFLVIFHLCFACLARIWVSRKEWWRASSLSLVLLTQGLASGNVCWTELIASSNLPLSQCFVLVGKILHGMDFDSLQSQLQNYKTENRRLG